MMSKPATTIRRLIGPLGVFDARDADLRRRGQNLADRIVERQFAIDVERNELARRAAKKSRHVVRAA